MRYVPIDDRWLAFYLAIVGNMTIDKAMAKLGHRYERPPKRTYTDEELDKMRLMKENGCSYHDIGAAIGISYAQAYCALRKERANEKEIHTP